MARKSTISYKYIAALQLIIVLLPYTIFSPRVLESYPQVLAVALAIIWVGEKVCAGGAAFALIMLGFYLHLALRYARQRLTGAGRTPPTPADPEVGTATTVPESVAPEADTALIPSPEKISPTTAIALTVPVTGSFLFYFVRVVQADLVSLEKPLLDNIGAVLLYVLRGLGIDFAIVLVVLFGVWITKGWRSRRRAAAAAAPHTVLFDEGKVAEEAAGTKEERERESNLEEAEIRKV
ncbi:hypothetical protein C8R44DRAFT_794385 [Mycena epipterygia]|nr:hypothetical protein C8R44DRAFT_794385 [Mycena epipterygia]